MLDTFRNLSDEATKLDSHNMTLETEYNTMRGSLDQFREQIHSLNHQLADKDTIVQSYEKQVCTLRTNNLSIGVTLVIVNCIMILIHKLKLKQEKIKKLSLLHLFYSIDDLSDCEAHYVSANFYTDGIFV